MSPREKADIVDRLEVGHGYKEIRDEHGGLTIWPTLQPHEIDQVMEEAATEIASLRRELAELREDKRIVDELLDAAIRNLAGEKADG